VGEVARSGGLVVLKSTTKYQGALMGLCARGGVLNSGEVARSGGLIVLQSTMDYQWVLMGEFARGGVLNCG